MVLQRFVIFVRFQIYSVNKFDPSESKNSLSRCVCGVHMLYLSKLILNFPSKYSDFCSSETL